jgi:hypothetical protein
MPVAKPSVPGDPGLDVQCASAVDLWSDGKRRQWFGEIPMTLEDNEELQALREAKLGADLPLLLTASALTDEELRQYLLSPAMSRWSYHLLRLACSFKKGVGERFARADLSIDLRYAEEGQERPITSGVTAGDIGRG